MIHPPARAGEWASGTGKPGIFVPATWIWLLLGVIILFWGFAQRSRLSVFDIGAIEIAGFLDVGVGNHENQPQPEGSK